MLNDELEEGELRRQLRSMRDQGVASVIARTYIGLKSDYPGKDWMKKMHVVVDEAKKLGMTVFMQACPRNSLWARCAPVPQAKARAGCWIPLTGWTIV